MSLGRISLLELVRLHDFVRTTYPRAAGALPAVTWAERTARELVDEHVDDTLVFGVISEVMRQARDPGLPMRFAQASRLEYLGVLGFAIQTSSTVREALDRMTRYQRLTSTSGETVVEARGPTVTLSWVRRPLPGSLGLRVANEVVLAQQVVLARQLGLDRPTKVRFQHRAPSDVSWHARLFGAPITWGAAVDALDWPIAWLERPLPLADPALAAFLEQEARRKLVQVGQPEPLEQRVEAAVLRLLPSGTPSLARVAADVGLQPRALQRLLASRGSTFRAALDEVRQRRARAAIDEGTMSMSELALLLGFSELSALSRASRRWFGAPPRRLRASRVK